MDKHITKQNGASLETESVSQTTKTKLAHKLNVPMDKSQMSKSDKVTVKAWKYTYANREKRID